MSVRVWDVPTRLFHWLLVVLIALQYATAEFHFLDMEWHFRFGYATLALIVFRLLWGIFGSQTSRFSAFVRGPSAVLRHTRVAVVEQGGDERRPQSARRLVGAGDAGERAAASDIGIVRERRHRHARSAVRSTDQRRR